MKHPVARRSQHHATAGFSLVELLVASTLSLVVMGAVATLFGLFGRGVTDGRAIVELNGRMRNAAWRLRQDLTGLTCVPAPLVRVDCNGGYFHVIEGSGTTPAGPDQMVGDTDDVLALTTSSPSAPFSGRLAGAQGFESPTAEVIWFCEQTNQEHRGVRLYNLHRRQLLVAATPDAGSFTGNVFAAKGDSDLSYGQRYVNSLGDLSKQANRFLTTNAGNRKLTGAREGEDVILGNVIAFDVQLATAGAPGNASFETKEDGDPAGVPVRGIEVRIRCIETSSDQIREIKVVHSFGAG